MAGVQVSEGFAARKYPFFPGSCWSGIEARMVDAALVDLRVEVPADE